MVLYLISKEDFATLYKYGEINVKAGAAAKSDNSEEAVRQIFSSSDPFEYAQEKMIVSCGDGPLTSVKMADVKDIYPLDEVSKNILESQFSSSLVFQEPVFKDIVESFLHGSLIKRTTISGINGLRSIFGIEEENDEGLIRDIILGKTFLQKYRKYFDVPFAERTPFSMLIAYNRYQHYPKDTRGFFFDAADCFMYGYMYAPLQDKGVSLLGYDRDLVSQLCQSYFGLLEALPADSKFRSIVDSIDNANLAINNAISNVYGSIRLVALYFFVKDRVVSEGSLTISGIKLLSSIRNSYPEDFPKLLTLIGGFLGYTWIYERLYEFKESPFLSVHHSLKELEPQGPKEPISSVTAAQEDPVNNQDSISTPENAPLTAPTEEAPTDSKQSDVQPVVSGSGEKEVQGLEHGLSEDAASTADASAEIPESGKQNPADVLPPEVVPPVAADQNARDISHNNPSVSEPEPIENEARTSEQNSSKDESIPALPDETLSSNLSQVEKDAQSPQLDLDTPNIIKAVFPRSSKRKEAFAKKLEDCKDFVTEFAINKDETRLRGIYIKLDVDFNPKKETNRVDAFVNACINGLIHNLL